MRVELETAIRSRRSCLVVPASSPRMIAKARTLDVDEVVVDFEDAVTPTQKTNATRAAVAEALRNPWVAPIRAIRVNAVGTTWFLDDVTQVVSAAGAGLTSIVLPKVESPAAVRSLDELLATLEAPDQRIAIEAQIESARGLVSVEDIASSSERLEALIFGPGDFGASLGIPQLEIGAIDDRYPGDQWSYPRSRIAVAAHANGLDPIDGPFAAYRDAVGLRESAWRARLLGFAGKWLIHPAQVEVCHEVFSPSDEDVARARRVVDALRDAELAGRGAASLNGTMIDEASRRLAHAVLVRAMRRSSSDPL